MRSLVLKSKMSKWRQVIKPVEILCNISAENIELPTYKIVDTIITKISDSFSKFKEVVATQLTCPGCKIDLKLTDSYCITLDQNKEMIKIENLLEIKTEQQCKKHYCTSETSNRIEVDCELKCNASSQICIFNSEFGIRHLSEKDRHKPTPERKKGRHKPTPKRMKDRHKSDRQAYYIKIK